MLGVAVVGLGAWPHEAEATATPVAKPDRNAKPPASARPAAAASAPTTFDIERLKAMVPPQIGRWKRVAAPAGGPARDDPDALEVRADYAAGSQRIVLDVSKAASAAPPPADLPSLTRTEAGHVLVYREGREIVVERLRRSDGRAQVTLRRDDGLTIVAEGTGVDPTRLKALARAVARRG